MAFQMWRKGLDEKQKKKKNPSLFKKVYFRKKILTKKAQRQQCTLATAMGILADRNHNYFRSRSFGAKGQLVCLTAFKGKSQLFLSVLYPLQLLKQNEDTHFCPKQ